MNSKVHFQGVCPAQNRIAAMEGPSASDIYDVFASLSYKRRQRRFILAKVNSSARAQLSIEGHEWKETFFVATKLCDLTILGSSALSQFESITAK